MKIALAVGFLAVVTSLLAARGVVTPPAPEPATPLAEALATGYHATLVRAEYVANGSRIANTVCHLTNTSISQSITLKQVIVVGTGGTNSIMAVYGGLVDVVVPPLGTVDLSIDNGIPGVVPETVFGVPGVRQVAFVWDGDDGILNLTASIETSMFINIYTRAELVEHGVAVEP